MYFANTHLHSDHSDGIWSPETLVELGKEIGHRAMLLTDHDTIGGHYRFERACRKAGILTLVSAEFSVVTSFGRMHIVAIDFNPENKEMRALLERQASRAVDYTRTVFEEELAKGNLRGGVTWQDVLDANPDVTYLTTRHVLDLYVARKIYTPEERNTVRPFLQREKAVQLEIKRRGGVELEPAEDVIRIILQAGGVPIIAHPTKTAKYFFEEEAERYIEMGVMGFEVNHPIMSAEEKAFYNEICDKHNLYKMGGIDHSGLLGGFSIQDPSHNADPGEGCTDQENFMKLYYRELG